MTKLSNSFTAIKTDDQLDADFDFLHHAVLENPYPVYQKLRDEQPVFWSNQMNAWLITRHQDVVNALANPAVFSSVRVEKLLHGYVDRKLATLPMRRFIKPLAYKMANRKMSSFVSMAKQFMWQLDPPEHTRLRKLMHIGYTKKQIEAIRPIIHNRTKELLDQFAGAGTCDFMRSFAVPLPAMVIADIYGLSDQWEELHELENSLKVFVGGEASDPKKALARALVDAERVKAIFLEAVQSRRAAPRDDLISRLIAAEEGGHKFTNDELVSNLVVTFGAAQVTTQDMLGNGLLALLRHPQHLQEVMQDRSKLPALIDEVIRYDGPVQLTNRVVTEATEVQGVSLKKGDFVYLFRGAANRDERVFSNPDTFDISRDNDAHVGFGYGIHYCIGSLLAKAEGEIAFNALFDRLQNLSFDANSVKWRADNLQFRGLEQLVIRFDNERQENTVPDKPNKRSEVSLSLVG